MNAVRRTRGRRVGARLAMLVAAVAMISLAGLQPAGATISPLAGQSNIVGTVFDLGQVGYKQSEYFLTGTARSYRPTGTLASDGRWKVAVDQSAYFKTRIVAYQPTDPKKFNGTVVVEWLNVSAGFDTAADWQIAHNELIRSGYGWVGVAAQAVGVNSAKSADPARYGSLKHPGDSFSYSIFTHAARDVRDNATRIFGVQPDKYIAVGQSQSAGRLTTYVNAVHPRVHVFDGYLIHSRSAGASPLSQAPLSVVTLPVPSQIRSDLDVPVLVLQAETDVSRPGLGGRQPDSANYRLWELAGSAHSDNYQLNLGFGDTGTLDTVAAAVGAMRNPPSSPLAGVIDCTTGINTGPMHWVLQAAFDAINKWVTLGAPPPAAPRLELVSSDPVVFALDANGNVKGGVRSPHLDAPVATLRGTGNTGAGTGLSNFCSLAGTTVPFSDAKLAALYPTHDAFAAKWTTAVQDAVAKGWLLPHDAEQLVAAAAT